MAPSADSNPVDAITVPLECYDPKTMRARVWDLERSEYRWVHAIDAREYVFYGAATFYKPGEEPDYTPVQTPTPSTTTPPAREQPQERISDSGAMKTMPTYPFAAHTVEELRVFAEEAEIDNYEELRKDRLVAALIASGYRPPHVLG